MRVWGRRARAGFGAAALAALGIGAVLAPAPASAGGGDWLFPVRDRYGPGQQATLVGYKVPYAYRWGAENEIDPDWRGRGPFYAYLRVIHRATAIREASEGTNPFVHTTDVRVGQVVPIPTSASPVRQAAATVATTGPPTSGPVVDAGKSPAGRAGVDPAGGISSEVVAWLMGFGVLLVVWCLAWRWRPQDARMVVRQANGQHAPPTSDDDPQPVHIKL